MASTTPTHDGRTVGRLGGRTLIVIIAIITSLLTLGLLVNDLVRVLYIFDGAYDIQAQIGSPLGVPLELNGAENTEAHTWTALLSSQQQLATPKILQAIALALTTLTFVAGGVTILLLCRRLWTGRTFAASATGGLLALAGVTLVASWLAPWLRHRADEIAFAEMGYPSSGTELWVELPNYDMFTVDSTAFLLGIVLTLAALVYLGSRRLQRDTDGLI